MLNTIQKKIIIRALRIRKNGGEDLQEVLSGYTNLTEEEKTEILKVLLEET